MPVLGTFNGFPILQMPASPIPKTLDFTAHDVVAVNESPFSGQQQIQNWQAGWLECSVSLPPLKHAQAQSWIAFLLQCGGQASVFQMGDPLANRPQGAVAANAQITTAQNKPGYALATTGWTPNASGMLLPGDWLQVGYRLYRNLEQVDPDGNGNAALSLWPQLREVPAPGTPLVLFGTVGLWRLNSNQRKWSTTEAKIYGIQFDVREAL